MLQPKILSFNTLFEAAIAAQECHIENQYMCAFNASGDEWDISNIIVANNQLL